jgi:hypothetical protein
VILGVDELMDMARTATNVIGNCLATVVVARWEGVFKGRRQRGRRGARSAAAPLALTRPPTHPLARSGAPIAAARSSRLRPLDAEEVVAEVGHDAEARERRREAG